MMSDIFSAFDPASFNSIIPSPLFIIINLSIILLIQLPFWSSSYRMSTTLFMMKTIMMSQLNRTFSSHIKGMNNNISSLFIMIILINLLGLAPYQFSLSSHLIITLSLGLPLWLSMILSSVTKFPKMFIAHLLPDGAQDWLNPFLVLIESTSITVRPLTLSFRLAANMSAGHIVLGLLGIYTTTSLFSSLSTSMILLPTAVGYILFEVAICLMQAYIFCLLLSLYSDEHAH